MAGRHVAVAGLGVSGRSAALALARMGADVTVVDGGESDTHRERAERLRAQGVTARLGDAETLPEGTDLVVTSPGWKPQSPLFAAAGAADVPVWGDVELAWRLRGAASGGSGTPAPWLAVTG
ncbi:MAG TPA: UDP-N-acetylmuramoyl-L-alanine--D-glutamate ligase, partial [Streptomyces sp.]|nr:UDP-N-acetylmuramoyl-L-alanine--D-glutamate ligase [Streptomyces sp.]